MALFLFLLTDDEPTGNKRVSHGQILSGAIFGANVRFESGSRQNLAVTGPNHSNDRPPARQRLCRRLSTGTHSIPPPSRCSREGGGILNGSNALPPSSNHSLCLVASLSRSLALALSLSHFIPQTNRIDRHW